MFNIYKNVDIMSTNVLVLNKGGRRVMEKLKTRLGFIKGELLS